MTSTSDTAIPAVVIMGVAGCGKSEIGNAISRRVTGSRVIEGDDFHPPENIKKMSAGTPLNDEDRAGWLARLGKEVANAVRNGERPILTCSALKLSYRDTLRSAVPGLGFVFLDLPKEVAIDRCNHRPGHFMPASLVDSQFATLERPNGEAGVLPVDATHSIDELGDQAADWWKASLPG